MYTIILRPGSRRPTSHLISRSRLIRLKTIHRRFWMSYTWEVAPTFARVASRCQWEKEIFSQRCVLSIVSVTGTKHIHQYSLQRFTKHIEVWTKASTADPGVHFLPLVGYIMDDNPQKSICRYHIHWFVACVSDCFGLAVLLLRG